MALAILVRHAQVPFIVHARLKRCAHIAYARGKRILHFTAVPDQAAVAFAPDLDPVGGLFLSFLGGFHYPAEGGVGLFDGEGLGPMLYPEVFDDRIGGSPDRKEGGQKKEQGKYDGMCLHRMSQLDLTKVRHFCIIV